MASHNVARNTHYRYKPTVCTQVVDIGRNESKYSCNEWLKQPQRLERSVTPTMASANLTRILGQSPQLEAKPGQMIETTADRQRTSYKCYSKLDNTIRIVYVRQVPFPETSVHRQLHRLQDLLSEHTHGDATTLWIIWNKFQRNHRAHGSDHNQPKPCLPRRRLTGTRRLQ